MKKMLLFVFLFLCLNSEVNAEEIWEVFNQEFVAQENTEHEESNCVPCSVYNALNIINVRTNSEVTADDIREEMLKANNETESGEGFRIEETISYLKSISVNYSRRKVSYDSTLSDLIDKGNICLFLVDMKYMPPEITGCTFEEPSNHCFLITGYKIEDNKKYYHVIDSACGNYYATFDQLKYANKSRDDASCADMLLIQLSEEQQQAIKASYVF